MKTRAFVRSRVVLSLAILFSLSSVMVQRAWAQAPSNRERAILRPGTSATDTRTAVLSTLMYPFSAVVRLLSTFPNGDQVVGTGAFVGPDRVVTAGHVIYDIEAGGYAKSVQVIPAYANGSTPFGVTHAAWMLTSNGYKEKADPNFDFGMLRTADALGWKTGWLGLKSTDNRDLDLIVLCGYPNDRGGTQAMYFAGGPSQWERGQNWREFTHRLQYEFWTDNGMSGGPLINNFFYIVGVHTGGNSNYNYAVSIDPEFLKWRLN
jgi:glutamyl endopeptidase